MKTAPLILAVCFLSGCAQKPSPPTEALGALSAPAGLAGLPPQVRTFIEQKEHLALTLADRLGVEPDARTLEYFQLARKGDYEAASEIYQELREQGGKVESARFKEQIPLPLWDPLVEVQLVVDAYASGAGRYATLFGERIARSLPPGGIYFGGTDTGRGMPGVFAPISNGVPAFFVLTQNQLVGRDYQEYLRAAFGSSIACLSDVEFSKGFEEYLEEASKRYRHDQNHPDEPRQMRPGETFAITDDDRIQVSGQVAVMMINGRLAKMLFEKNPDREFFIEESFPLDWMYPHLTPHDLILRLHHEPVRELSPELIATNRRTWDELQTQFIGRWLTPETTDRELSDFVEGVFVKKDLAGFQGDPGFVGNRYASAAFSKLRSAQAGLFEWRFSQADSATEKQRMWYEAEWATRQAFAFCPVNPEAVQRLAMLHLRFNRKDEALRVVQLAKQAAPENPAFDLIEQQIRQPQ